MESLIHIQCCISKFLNRHIPYMHVCILCTCICHRHTVFSDAVDLEDVPSTVVSSSPPQSSGVEKMKDFETPPNSPSGNAHMSQIQ